ncbi:MAG: hypothetical protein ACE5F8_03670 [Woeseiaceae bacterium]
MYWSKRLAVVFALNLFVTPAAIADKGDFILGVGVEADDVDGVAASLFGDFSVGERTWITATAARNEVELSPGVESGTWFGSLDLDHYFKPAGIRIGVSYWGDSDILDSIDVRGSLYTRGDRGTLAFEYEHRSFEFDLPPIDLLPRAFVPFNANGFGLSGQFNVSDSVNLHLRGMKYEYDVERRSPDAVRIVDFLSISRLSLLSSLIDWQVGAGIGFDVGLKRWQLDVARWRGSIDGGDNQSVTVRFLTPMTNRTDIEIGLGFDSSELHGDVIVASLFLYFYGGD